MPFIETEAKSRYEIIDGKKTHVITPECFSDKEADDDVNDGATATKREHIRRDVNLKIASIDLGAGSGDL